MGKKKFIDKKKSATFQLYARDSSDPNYDETPGKDRVFVRVDNNPYSVETFFADENPRNSHHYDENPNSIFADAPDDIDELSAEGEGRVCDTRVSFGEGFHGEDSPGLPDDVRREILELGFPDDGYNYLIHLREIKNTGGGSAFFHNPKAKLDQLPGDVKAYDASKVRVCELKNEDRSDRSIYSVAEKTVGARVQKVMDPEVAALLDDSDLSRFGSDDEDLEEDFVVRANGLEEGEDLDVDKKMDFTDEFELVNDANDKSVRSAGHQDDFVGEVRRIRRPLDEQFDLLERQEYGTDDEDEYDGSIGEEDESLANKLKHALKDYRMVGSEVGDKYEGPADLLHGSDGSNAKELLDSAADVIRRCREYGKSYENDDKGEEIIIEEETSSESEMWDCETIVSTYSNLDNHPAKIEAPGISRKKLAQTVIGALDSSQVISLRGKEKIPVDFLPHSKKSAEEKKCVPSLKTEQKRRKQHGQESKEEKKERKAAVKEEKREARRVKKEIKGLYRSEAQRAQKAVAVAGPSSIRLM